MWVLSGRTAQSESCSNGHLVCMESGMESGKPSGSWTIGVCGLELGLRRRVGRSGDFSSSIG